MQQVTGKSEPASAGAPMDQLADTLFRAHQRIIYIQTDRLFAGLMAFQWVGCVIAALVISPHTWIGLTHRVHVHVWSAIILGGLISGFPILLTLLHPGATLTRFVIATAQMMMSALLIHVTGGRIETHFHVFGSLAFLAFYRDWRVLVPATIVVASDHFFRGLYYPQSVYGVLADSRWRFLEHAWWVVFEDVFLVTSCIRSTREMRSIALRTAELSRAKETAEAATDAAQAASRAKSEFLANMSHEIRTPMNGVIGMIDLLLGSKLDERQHRHASVVKTSADSLLTLINDILDFSKIEAGKLELVSAEFDVGVAVEDVVEVFAARAERKGIELAAHIDPAVRAPLLGDSDRLRQILVNLISNAIKFTERGHVIVRVAAATETDTHITARFTITDSGIGIPRDRLDRLFKSFSQVDASTTRKYGGTGLGLAISRQLAALMGGEMDVESTEGKGSTFWFTIKFDKSPRLASVRKSVIDPRGYRVLVVDDSDAHRGVVMSQLASWGLEADAAANATHALRAFETARAQHRPFRVVIMDTDLPDMKAEELAQRMRTTPSADSDDTVLMILSGLDGNCDPAALGSRGFAGFITKPVRQSTLLDTIMTAIARSTGKLSLPTKSASAPTATARIAARTERLLLVEDNEVNQMVAVDVLTDAGFTVDVVGNGKLAIDAVAAEAFDLVLMDCQMPVMDGFEACAAIRGLQANGKLPGRKTRMPIIALTANALKGDREKCLAAGMDDYVSKPIEAAALIRAINALLPKPATTTPVVAPAPAVVINVPAQPAASPTAPEPAVAIFDEATLLRRCLNKPAFAAKLLTTFENGASTHLETLTMAVIAGNADDANREAHSLRGSAKTIAAEPLAAAAAAMESAARIGDADMAAALEQVRQELERCISCLPTIRDRLTAAVPNSAPVGVRSGLG